MRKKCALGVFPVSQMEVEGRVNYSVVAQEHRGQKWLQCQPRKVKGYVKYRTSYNKAWEKTFGFIARSSVSDQHIFCTVCQKHVSIAHQGSCDIKRHARGQQHVRRMASLAHQAAQGIVLAQYPVEEKPREPLLAPFYTQASPEVKLEEMPPNKETLPPAEDRGVGGGGGGGGGNGGNVEFNQNNGEEVAVGVSTGGSSPDQYQGGDGSEREPTPAPPTPTQQKPESYQLRHNNHLTLVLEALARDESFMDVTLTAQGRSLKAHKSVLSAVSPYFRGVLRDNPCQHPIIIMPRDVRFEELFSIVNYIYKGEMTVAAEDLTSLLKTAEILQVSGLAPSDSTATFNPQHETLTTGNLRSSSTSSSASSSNTPARPIRSMKQTSQRTFTPPPRPKSGDSSINPTDFMDVDMTCVKEEVTSGGEDDDAEEQIAKLPCPQSSPGDDLHHGSDAPIHDNNLPNYSLPYDQCLQQSLPSTSSTTIFRPLTSTTEALDPSTSSIKTDPDTDLNPQLCAIETAHPMRCPHCEEQHRDIDTLLTHLRIRHPTKPSFTCGCGRVFTRQAYQQAHSKLCPNAS